MEQLEVVSTLEGAMSFLDIFPQSPVEPSCTRPVGYCVQFHELLGASPAAFIGVAMITDSEMIESIQACSSAGLLGANFDCSFVDKLEKSLGEWGRLTERQAAALENIYNKFNVEEKMEQL